MNLSFLEYFCLHYLLFLVPLHIFIRFTHIHCSVSKQLVWAFPNYHLIIRFSVEFMRREFQNVTVYNNDVNDDTEIG